MPLTPGRNVVNAPVRLSCNFQDEDGTDIDPTTVKFRVRSPSLVETSYLYGTDAALQRYDTGDYYIDFTPTESGRWFYRWQSTGTNKTTGEEGTIVVQYSPFEDADLQDAYR